MNLADYLLDQRIVEGMGERMALRTDRGDFSYAQVQGLANQAAHWLAARGLQPEQRLLLAIPDSWEFVVALFGALKLGAAVVMANPDLSADDLSDLAQYVRASVVLTTPGRAAFARELKNYPAQFDTFPCDYDDIALWLFSGGTTGKPKAVLQSHGSFRNTTERYAKDFLGYGPDDITLAVPKLYFGYATGSNLFFPFSVGASAILFEERPTAELLFEKIRAYRPSLLINVPTMVNQMTRHPQAGEQDLSSLRACTSAGEALPESLHTRWNELFGVELLDGLGTAEMWHIFLSNAPGQVRPGSLGRAVPGFEVLACDSEGREVPVGEIGQMWVRGDSRGLCYWQRRAESLRVFRGDTYVSNDLIRCDDEGYIYFCGRADEMLKVGGRWLEPQQVESVLLTHPQVAECAVVGHLGEDGLTRPKAFVVARIPGSAELEDELKQHVLAALEPYKHPRRIHFVDSLPRTHLGKVNRAELRGWSPPDRF